MPSQHMTSSLAILSWPRWPPSSPEGSLCHWTRDLPLHHLQHPCGKACLSLTGVCYHTHPSPSSKLLTPNLTLCIYLLIYLFILLNLFRAETHTVFGSWFWDCFLNSFLGSDTSFCPSPPIFLRSVLAFLVSQAARHGPRLMRLKRQAG